MATTRTFTLKLDGDTEALLDRLKTDFKKSTRAEVFRLAIALLEVASDAKRRGEKLAVTKGDKIKKEILIPG